MTLAVTERHGPVSSSRLAEALFGAQPWIADALCRQHPEVDFLADDKRDDVEPARAICRRCPVAQPCLDYALALGASTTGVWGSTTGQERADIRRRRRPV
jgi:WhiB family redox-sensing transcriptional regulator